MSPAQTSARAARLLVASIAAATLAALLVACSVCAPTGKNCPEVYVLNYQPAKPGEVFMFDVSSLALSKTPDVEVAADGGDVGATVATLDSVPPTFVSYLSSSAVVFTWTPPPLHPHLLMISYQHTHIPPSCATCDKAYVLFVNVSCEAAVPSC